MTNGQRRCFQLLNAENRSIADATFEGPVFIKGIASLSLSEMDVQLFHAGCRNILLNSKWLAEVDAESSALVDSQRAALNR